MRAARYYGKEDIRIEHDVEPAQVGEGQVKIAPAFVGICGTGEFNTRQEASVLGGI